jgi:hypothetical protein
VTERKKRKMEATHVEPAVRCSFCGKDRKHVDQMVAGPGLYICDGCIALCARILTDKPTAPFVIWKTLTDDELLAALPATAATVDGAESTLRDHVQMLRDRSVSWERIAGVLGVSRQAAWERFSRES